MLFAWQLYITINILIFIYILGRSSLPCIWLWVPTGQHVGGSSSPVLLFPLEPWILIPAMLVVGPSSSLMCLSVSLDLVLTYFCKIHKFLLMLDVAWEHTHACRKCPSMYLHTLSNDVFSKLCISALLNFLSKCLPPNFLA